MEDGCFTGDTSVVTKDGYKRIDKIKEEELVLSKNVNTGETGYKAVKYVYIKNTTDFIYLNIEGEEIKTTPSHLFFTDSGWWKSAKDLMIGDKIIDTDGIMKTIKNVSIKKLAKPELIYNLNIEDYHTYFVGRQGVFVHNDCTMEMSKAFQDAVKDAKSCGVTNTDQLIEIGVVGADGARSSLLSSDGKFVDSVLESDYYKYVAQKVFHGKSPKDRLDWKVARDYWLKDTSIARGNAFNKKAIIEKRYPFNEVNLENGKRLDSYNEELGEIVSRKATSLEEIQIATFEEYLKEMKYKYMPGTKIRSNTNPDIDGHILQGKQILEIPASNQTFSRIQEYIDLAKNKYRIEICSMEE